MAQLSLFDAIPPEPKVPRPPARNKKDVSAEEIKKTPTDLGEVPKDVTPLNEPVAKLAVNTTGIHFEPAPIYTEEVDIPHGEPTAIHLTPPPEERIEEKRTSLDAGNKEDESTALHGEIEVEVISLGEVGDEVEVVAPVEVVASVEIVAPVEEDSVAPVDAVMAEAALPSKNADKVTNSALVETKSQASHSLKEENVPYGNNADVHQPSIDTAQLTKQYYSISEVSAMFNVNASHLRYWEKEFPAQLGKVRKNGKGDRFYTPKNIEQLQVLFYLVKTKKMTLEGARDYLKQKKRGIKSDIDAISLLQQVRGFLVALKKELNE